MLNKYHRALEDKTMKQMAFDNNKSFLPSTKKKRRGKRYKEEKSRAQFH